LGTTLVDLYRGHFNRDLKRMLRVLLDEHPAGWSTINNCDFNLKPGYSDAPSGTARQPRCYCHGDRNEKALLVTEESDCGAEWAYVFDVEEKILHVLDRQKHTDSQEYFWQDVGRIELDSDEPINWTTIECGEDFDR
jgi:hypothetical protein